MKIAGFQKLTLLDYSPLAACTVFTGGCNLRCPFCHNSSLIPIPKSGTIKESDVLEYLRARKNVLQGVCITGGEPLMQSDLADFIKEIKTLNYAVKLDTNGTLPDELKKILDKKLIDYVAMDIKNSPQGYAATCGVKDINLRNIENSINLLLSSDIAFEFRTTLVKELHSENDLHAIGKWLTQCWLNHSEKLHIRYFLQAFSDSKDVPYGGLTAFNKDEMQHAAEILTGYGINTSLRGI